MGDGPSEMIMLMTGLIVAGLVSAVLLSTWDTISQGLENQGELEIKDAKTRASLISDPSLISWDNAEDKATIFIQNSGTISLSIDDTYVFLDGNTMSVSAIDAAGVTWSKGVAIKFEIDSFKKKCLLNGLDDIALSLVKSEKISSFEDQYNKSKPWIS